MRHLSKCQCYLTSIVPIGLIRHDVRKLNCFTGTLRMAGWFFTIGFLKQALRRNHFRAPSELRPDFNKIDDHSLRVKKTYYCHVLSRRGA
jgi:hypothetical protein